MGRPYYYAKDGRQLGPVSSTELKAMANTGSLQPSDLVWNEEMPTWKPAGSIKGLFGTAGRTTAVLPVLPDAPVPSMAVAPRTPRQPERPRPNVPASDSPGRPSSPATAAPPARWPLRLGIIASGLVVFVVVALAAAILLIRAGDRAGNMTVARQHTLNDEARKATNPSSEITRPPAMDEKKEEDKRKSQPVEAATKDENGAQMEPEPKSEIPSVTVEEMMADFKANAKEAKEKYGSKPFVVRGVRPDGWGRNSCSFLFNWAGTEIPYHAPATWKSGSSLSLEFKEAMARRGIKRSDVPPDAMYNVPRAKMHLELDIEARVGVGKMVLLSRVPRPQPFCQVSLWDCRLVDVRVSKDSQ